jgi:aspartate kinase
VEAFYAGKKDEAIQLFEQVKQQHLTTAKYLLVTHWQPCEQQLKDFFTEVEWLLHDKPARNMIIIMTRWFVSENCYLLPS